MPYKTIGQLKTIHDFISHLARAGIDLPCDTELLPPAASPFALPYTLSDGFTIGNRFCVHPMEGWDCTPAGAPSELTFRRWENFGRSGAKLIWGGEAAAVRHDGRANPNQLLLNAENLPAIVDLRRRLVDTHAASYGSTADLLIGLQLTHSGRYAQPNQKGVGEPLTLYRHPYLDPRVGIKDDSRLMSDADIRVLIGQFVQAAELAQAAGFDFVDLKHCHGYLGHEFLSAYSRPGDYGGSFENRTRFLRELAAAIRERCPGLRMGVRLSMFDMPPFFKHADTQIGTPTALIDDQCYWFGTNPANPWELDLAEPARFLELCQSLGIEMVNLTAGSPYYNPHIQRPAYFPPSDGYLPPEDPLVGVARQMDATAELKQRFPRLLIVGTAYTYLQDWLAHVAQYNLTHQRVDFIGLGRMILSYPEFPADLLRGRPLRRKRVCRTFSDCTTGPRKGLPSGCYPLDEFYKKRPEAAVLKEFKKV